MKLTLWIIFLLFALLTLITLIGELVGYQRFLTVKIRDDSHSWLMTLCNGRTTLSRVHRTRDNDGEASIEFGLYPFPLHPPRQLHIPSLAIGSHRVKHNRHALEIMMRSNHLTCFPFALSAASWIGIRFLSKRRRSYVRLGFCVRCGYNLHGLTEPRCPECGTPFEMSSKSEAVSSEEDSSQQDATP